MAESSFSLVVVGTGFASTFFLHRYLARAPATSRILVLERGRNLPLSWQLKNRATSLDQAGDLGAAHRMLTQRACFRDPDRSGSATHFAD